MSNCPPGTSILPSCHRQATAQKSRSPRFPPPHNRHRTIVRNQREKSGKETAYLVRIVHCSPLSCKRFQKRKIQLKSFLSFHFLATFLCVLLQLKLSTGGLVPSAGLAAVATAWNRPVAADDDSCRLRSAAAHTELRSTEIYTLPHKFPAKLRKEKCPVFFTNI